MWRFRLLLIPFAITSELILLSGCWVVAIISPKKGAVVTRWCENILPDKLWYIGEK